MPHLWSAPRGMSSPRPNLPATSPRANPPPKKKKRGQQVTADQNKQTKQKPIDTKINRQMCVALNTLHEHFTAGIIQFDTHDHAVQYIMYQATVHYSVDLAATRMWHFASTGGVKMWSANSVILLSSFFFSFSFQQAPLSNQYWNYNNGGA